MTLACPNSMLVQVFSALFVSRNEVADLLGVQERCVEI
jgi:hypothetical protein